MSITPSVAAYSGGTLTARIASFVNDLSEHWDACAGGCRATVDVPGD